MRTFTTLKPTVNPFFQFIAQFALTACTVVCFCRPLQAQPTQRKLEINKLTGNFYIYTTYNTYQGIPVPANGLYLVTSEGVVLIDSPWDTTQFQPLLDSIAQRHQQKVVLCIATHSHEDRTAGLEYYRSQGIKTYTTRLTDSISQTQHHKKAQFLLSQDTTFVLGKETIQTYYPGPGHTRDNIVVWFEHDKILYGGCFIKSTKAKDLGYVQEADLKQWPLSLQKVQQKFKKPNYVIPGHQDWLDNRSIAHTLELLRTRK